MPLWIQDLLCFILYDFVWENIIEQYYDGLLDGTPYDSINDPIVWHMAPYAFKLTLNLIHDHNRYPLLLTNLNQTKRMGHGSSENHVIQ